MKKAASGTPWIVQVFANLLSAIQSYLLPSGQDSMEREAAVARARFAEFQAKQQEAILVPAIAVDADDIAVDAVVDEAAEARARFAEFQAKQKEALLVPASAVDADVEAAEAERQQAMTRARESALAIADALEADKQRAAAAKTAFEAKVAASTAAGEEAKVTVVEADLEFELEVSKAVKPGDKLPAMLPDGNMLTVVVEEAAEAGSTIGFTIPSSALPEWKANLDSGTDTSAIDSVVVSEADLEFEIEVSEAVKPGDKLPALLPDGNTLTVVVEEAAEAGSLITFTVPSSALPEWKNNVPVEM